MKKIVKIALSASLLVAATGCTRVFLTGFDAQSHYDYPNSNVIPLGKVEGESSKTFILSPPLIDAEMQEAAIKNALSKKPGADILINYTEFQEITPVLFITTLKYRVEGTAAKMEIGTQKLR